MVWKGIDDHNVAVAVELERQKGIPQKNTERWKKWKDENGVRPRGYDTLEVWRDPRTMRFSKPPTPQQLAQMFGMKTGADLPIPNRRNNVRP
ncbi:MAG: hypothetical protein JWN64_636 [Parcubacteria group bacterium]|nr:hypothetical protein [Parcubacteria group bacterium]